MLRLHRNTRGGAPLATCGDNSGHGGVENIVKVQQSLAVAYESIDTLEMRSEERCALRTTVGRFLRP